MIDKAIVFLHQRINQHLKINLKDDPRAELISLSGILKQDGTVAIADNSMALTLINLEEETTMGVPVNYINSGNDHGLVNPDLHLNMHLLVTANYNNYAEGLKSLGLVLRFFQGQNVFNAENSADIESVGVQKLIVKLCKIPFEKQNHVWGTLGAKYMPSAIYKVTMISIQEGQILELVPSSSSVDNQISPS